MSVTDARRPLVGWRQRAFDIGLAVIAVSPGVVSALAPGPVTAASGLSVVLLVATAVALYWRARAPWRVLTLVALFAAIGDSRLFTLALCLAVFELARRESIRRAALGYLVAVGLPLLGTTVKIMLGFNIAATGDVVPALGVGTSIVDPYVVLACAAGVVVQSTLQRRRAQAALLEERIDSARALERARITAEMHDIVGHALTVMISLAGGARAAWQTDPERARQALAHLGEVGATALEDMQRTLRVLRDSDQALDDSLHHSGYDLPDIEVMIEVFRSAGMPVTFERSGDPIPASAMLHAAIHRIVQECLTNVLRYAHGTESVKVDLVCSAAAGTVTIRVEDDGIPGGIPSSALYARTQQGTQSPRIQPSQGTGRGLIGVAERAHSFGGSCVYGPRSPRGWSVTATLGTEKPR